ncbi:MAG TPA: efflux RND transporter permease subunit [Gammaproteobacteria bacterium]|nr:efflux RND transporter permease subunit [Gammaproteobacteria bacterium]HIL99319.1 efflux RND transporter permease subunit [Pseudomonadales bacterium]
MKGPIAWFANNHVAANLMMGLIVMAGLMALPGMPQKSMPDIDINIITVAVPYLGAAPEEVEEGVCIRIEEELDGVEGVKQIQSTANEGTCTVSVELYENADPSKGLDDVKNRIDAIDTFPEETEKPIITLATPQRSVMDIALTGPKDERTLKVLGQRVRDEIAALPEITHVSLTNTRPYEVSVEVSEASLRRNGLSFEQLAQAVRSASLDLPGGSIKTEGGEVLLRTKGQAYWGHEFDDLVILTRPDGTRLHLRDVADVVDGFEDTDQMLRFDGEPAAIIRVSRIGDQDVIEITEALRRYLVKAEADLPDGVELTIWNDGSKMLRDRLDTLLSSARQGFFMVLILLALFLRPRLAFWVSLGVPVAFMGAIFLVSSLGMSIDGISLFGFILVLGILVDDAIVVGENIHSNQRLAERGGEGSMLESAIKGTQQVSVPVIFGVLTTVTAFMPFLFGPGVMGQIQSVIGTVVMCCLFFSLIESQLILPSHLGHHTTESAEWEVGLLLIPIFGILILELAWDTRSYIAIAIAVASAFMALQLLGGFRGFANRVITIQSRFANKLESLIQVQFRDVVDKAIAARYITISIALVALLSSIGILASGRLPFSFFPPLASDQVVAKLTMPLGTPATVTNKAVVELERSARIIADQLSKQTPKMPPVKHMLTAIGNHPSSNSGGGPPSGPRSNASGGHLGEVTMQLTSSQSRDISTREIANLWRKETRAIPDAVELIFSSSLFSAGEAINIQLEGDNLDDLRVVAEKIGLRLAEYPGVIDISDSFRSGKKELKLDILPSGESLGLTLAMLARQVRQAFYGEEIQRIQRGRDDVRIMVRYTKEERRTLGTLDRMRIRTPQGSEVPFTTVADASLGRGFSSIKRSDRRRVVNVTADVDRTQITANEVIADFGDGILESIMQDHPRVSYRLEGQQRQQGEAVSSLIPLFGLALFVIYALLAIPLRSYSQPLIIMSVIPFALVGAIWGHMIMKSFGLISGLAMMSVLGFIAASGVVVNSSLVLVHTIDARRCAGRSIHDAVLDAAVSRCRPIILTSLTTFVGLTPLMLNRSVSAQFLVPMGISLAFGVLFATVVTLLVVPSGYLILQDLSRKNVDEVALDEGALNESMGH